MPEENEIPENLSGSVYPSHTWGHNNPMIMGTSTAYPSMGSYPYQPMTSAVLLARADQATLDAIRQIVREELAAQREDQRDLQHYEENQE